MTDLALSLLISAKDQGASSLVSSLGKSFSSMAGSGGPLGLLAGGLALAGTAVIGLGVMSVKSAGDFQQAMLQVKSSAAPATENIKAMGDSLLQMAPQVGSTPTDLAKGLYFVESAGLHGKAALDAVRLSAMAAANGGLKDMKVVADAATSAVNSFGIKNLSVKTAIDVMSGTVAQGKTTWDQYSRAVSKLASSAAMGHTSFQEANASLALFTRTGESAQLASGHLGSLMLYMGTQSVKMAANAKKAGVAFDAQKFSSMNLADKIEYLNKASGNNFSVAQKILSGNKTLTTTYEKLHENVGTYKNILDSLNHSQGATEQAFKITSQGYNQQMKQMGAAFDVLKITIGNALLPALTGIMKTVSPLIGQATTYISKNHLIEKAMTVVGNVVKQVGDILKNGLIPAWDDFQTTIRPILPQLKIFGQFLGGVLVDALKLLAHQFVAMSRVVSGIFEIIGGLISVFVDLFTGKFNKLGDDLGIIWHGIGTVISGEISALTNSAFGWGANLIGSFIGGIKSMIGSVGAAASSIMDEVKSMIGVHSPTRKGPGRELTQWGPNLVKQFAGDIASNSTKARAAAENMMKQVSTALQNYPKEIYQAKKSGNAGLEYSLKEALAMARATLTDYKDVIKQAGDKYNQYDANPIDFTKKKTHGKHPKAGNLFIGGQSFNAPTGTGGSSSFGSGLTINNHIVINAPHADAKQIYALLIKEITRDLKRSGGLVTTTSGGKA